MALEQMDGFELAGRTVCIPKMRRCRLLLTKLQLRVNTVHEKGNARYTQQESLDEAGGMSQLILRPAECVSLTRYYRR